MGNIMKIDRQSVIFIVSVAFIVAAFSILLSFNIIGYGVEEKCRLAEERYGGDCVGALVAHLDDDSNSFRSRNSAVWALGQLGDARGLPTLEAYFSGVPESRESLDETISQYELQKAIKLIDGGFNLTAFFWR